MRRPLRWLDLYCGQGGVGHGLRLAGATSVLGVDLSPQPRYPYGFEQGDALDTEACAMKALPAFAAQWAPADEVGVMVAAAQAWDAALPATYKGASC